MDERAQVVEQFRIEYSTNLRSKIVGAAVSFGVFACIALWGIVEGSDGFTIPPYAFLAGVALVAMAYGEHVWRMAKLARSL